MQIHEIRAKVEELHQAAKTDLDTCLKAKHGTFSPHISNAIAAREYAYMQVLELFKKML